MTPLSLCPPGPDDNSLLLARLCSSEYNNPYVSTQKHMYVRFSTETSLSQNVQPGTGFRFRLRSWQGGCWSVNQSVCQLVSQSVSQSISQSVSQPVTERPALHRLQVQASQLAGWVWVSQPICLSISQSISLSVSQSACHRTSIQAQASVSGFAAGNVSVGQSVSQWINQSICP